MAYLEKIDMRCQEGWCKTPASVRLRDQHNNYQGRFCLGCGKKKLQTMEVFERENPELAGLC